MTVNPDSVPRHETVLDADSRRVARIYAESLLDAAAELNQTDEVLDELAAFIDGVLGAASQFEAFLLSGAASGRKAEVIRRAFDGQASDLFRNFLLVLNAHRRLDLLRGIREAATELHGERAGRMPVLVTSAVPLRDDECERLRQQLRARFRKEPVLTARVEPDLLGGITVRVGDWLYDASVRARLETVRQQIIDGGRHVAL
jgi:F-type H+-transporting ATPase subunit delta